jgi:hypothetical protein
VAKFMNTLASRQSACPSMAAILPAGLLCGTLDITAAFLVYGRFGVKPLSLLQGIAAGLLGPRSLDGGWPTAILGLFLHFVIAFGATTVFVLASRRLWFLIDQPFVAGPLYGIAVYFFMSRIVVPLSAAPKHTFSLEIMLIGITIHIFCIGLPIALVTRYYRVK